MSDLSLILPDLSLIEWLLISISFFLFIIMINTSDPGNYKPQFNTYLISILNELQGIDSQIEKLQDITDEMKDEIKEFKGDYTANNPYQGPPPS